MLDWRDEGLLLTVRPHGEHAAIIDVFTPTRGRHVGVVRGGTSRRLGAVLQPGNQIAVEWRARLEEHLGHFTVEPVQSRSHLWQDRLALDGLSATLSLLHHALPERDAHPALYEATLALLAAIGAEAGWPALYVQWELLFLEELGFGLDLSACAVTGRADDLAYVSPRTGRAVSRAGAGEWAARLLPLPGWLAAGTAPDPAGIVAALRLTGHFIDERLVRDLSAGPLPEARRRLIERLARRK